MTTNPYAPPNAIVTDPTHLESAPAIWNPNAAANWSLVFSPAFGSFIHMLNWRILGEPEKAASAKRWFVFSLIILSVSIVIVFFLPDPKATDGVVRGLGLLSLFAWYFVAGRSQAKYIKAKFGKSYPRKPWGKPLLIGLLGWFSYVGIAVIVGLVFIFVSGFMSAMAGRV